MQNYFNYFTEIEERFQQRRGTILMLSALDWALIKTWREAGVPLEAVLRGIDAAFDKYEAKKQRGRARKINGLAWTAQAVMEAAQAAAEAATGTYQAKTEQDTGFEQERVAEWLRGNAAALEAGAGEGNAAIAARLRELADAVPANMEELDRTLTVLEEKLFAALKAEAAEAELVALREQADRELAPYRGKMGAVQMRQVREQFMQKRLLEARGLPRLSLFYMPQG